MWNHPCWETPQNEADDGLGMRMSIPAQLPPPPVPPPRREVLQIDQFLKETAAREANAKVRLQHFIEELLDRADRAEKQLQIISSSCGTTPNGSLGRCGTPGAKAIGRPVPARAQARAPHIFGNESSRGFLGGCKRVEWGRGDTLLGCG